MPEFRHTLYPPTTIKDPFIPLHHLQRHVQNKDSVLSYTLYHKISILNP